MIPDAFRQEILGEELDENQVLIEKADKASVDFACGFDIESDTGRKSGSGILTAAFQG